MKKSFFSSCLKAAATVLLAFAVASCAQSAGGDDEGTVSGAPAGGNAANVRRVSISVNDDKKSSGPSMMILPSVGSTLYADDGTIRYSPIILTGTSAKGTQVGGSATGINLEGKFDSSGKADVDLDATYWELTLTAYDKASGKPALRGVRAVDLTHGVADVKFTLSPGKLDDGSGSFINGTVNIAGTFTSSAADIVNVQSYKIGLYERNKKELTKVAGYETTELVTSPASFSFALDRSSAYSCPPGEYLFVLQLLDGSGAVVTQYSDLIIVDSGLCTEKLDLVIEDEDAVAAPTDFMAYLVDGSQDNGKYNVKFTWNPEPSWNATQFVLQITDIDSPSGETQTLPSELAGSGEGNFASYVDGSLMAGAEYCIVSLPANRRFEATIMARSARGRTSDPVNREAATGTETGCTGFGADSVNQLMRIYELAGGTYTDADGNEHSPRFFDWNTFTGSDIALLPVNNVSKEIGSGASAMSVACTKWKRNNADGSVDVFDPADTSYAPPSGFVAGTYTAVYPSTSIVAILEPHETKLLTTSEVTLTGGDLNGTKLKIAANEPVGIAVTDSAMDADHPSRFIGYKIMATIEHKNTVLYCEANTTGSFSYTIPASTFAPGSYDLYVIGVGTDNYDYSTTFKLLVHSAGH